MTSIKSIARIAIPLLLAGIIMWCLYKGFDWAKLQHSMTSEMAWGWMLLSLPFGVLAQVLRAIRWRQMLTPIGEPSRLRTSICAIYLSYASSLIIPRVGEVLRCGVLKQYDGTNFSRAVGTVVTERLVDVAFMLAISIVAIVLQADVFLTFCQQTGMSVQGTLNNFTTTGYLLAGVTLIALILLGIVLTRRMKIFARVRAILQDVSAGFLSIRNVKRPFLFLANSAGIWVCYYLHFYLALLCFPATASVGWLAALVAFVVGGYAVLVPTPNGAGPWHFAIMTVLTLYGVGQEDSAVCALVTHTLQTLLVAALGIYAMCVLALTQKRQNVKP